MIKFEINKQEVYGFSGETILDVARRYNIYIPSLCYLSKDKPSKISCGLCVVEVKGEGIKRACETKIKEGLKVFTNTPEVKKIRKELLQKLIKNHYGDCKAPCHVPCPGGLNIQGYIGLIAKGDFKGALALIKEKLPLPASVGRVCPRFCEPVCRRALVDEPIAINHLKRFVADYGLKYGEDLPSIPPSTGKRVAIIGAGPSGLSCAYFLRLKGHEVTIFDAHEEPGGLLRYGIPSYKLPIEIVRKEVENIFRLDIEFQGGKVWGKDFSLKDLFEQGFSAIFIGVGARKERKLGFEGEELALSGLKLLFDIKENKFRENLSGKRVLVIAGGYTAIAVARSIRRLSADVYVIYRRSKLEMPIPQRELRDAEKEGIKFLFMSMPLKIQKEGDKYRVLTVKTILSEPDEHKVRKVLPAKGTEEWQEFDLVIKALREGPETDFVNYGKLEEKLEINPGGYLVVNNFTLETNVPGVFAGGDFIYGPKTVIQAVASGRKAAQSINTYLLKEKSPKKTITVKFDFSRGKRLDQIDPYYAEQFSEKQSKSPKELPISEKISSFKEIYSTFSEKEAIEEAQRCLQCGCLGFHKCEFREILIKENVSVIGIPTKFRYPLNKDHPLINVDLNKCIACFRCMRACPYNSIEMKIIDKGTPEEHITFYFKETCVKCGICVDVCPTGALTKKEQKVPYSLENVKIVKSVCGYCGVGCNINIHVRNNTILEITGENRPPNYGNLCVKGRFGFEIYKNEERLKKPLIREDRKDEFKEVSWEEALDFVAEKLSKIKKVYGSHAIGLLSSSKITNEENYLAQKFARAVLGTNNIDCSARV